MQTFLPYPSFYESLKVLDSKRLGKQRLEAMQLVNSTLKLEVDPNANIGWANHPARTMWRGYLDALKMYHNLAIQEWVIRGFKNTMKTYEIPEVVTLPPWIGRDDVHASHRSNLIRKDPIWYGKFGWSEPSTLEYVWPV